MRVTGCCDILFGVAALCVVAGVVYPVIAARRRSNFRSALGARVFGNGRLGAGVGVWAWTWALVPGTMAS
jgi:hypothetical protein